MKLMVKPIIIEETKHKFSLFKNREIISCKLVFVNALYFSEDKLFGPKPNPRRAYLNTEIYFERENDEYIFSRSVWNNFRAYLKQFFGLTFDDVFVNYETISKVIVYASQIQNRLDDYPGNDMSFYEELQGPKIVFCNPVYPYYPLSPSFNCRIDPLDLDSDSSEKIWFKNYGELLKFQDFFNSYYLGVRHKLIILYPTEINTSLTFFDLEKESGLLVLKTNDNNPYHVYWDDSLPILLFDNLSEDYKYYPVPITRNKDGRFYISYITFRKLFYR